MGHYVVRRKWYKRSDGERERKSGDDIKQILLCPCRIALCPMSFLHVKQINISISWTSGVSFWCTIYIYIYIYVFGAQYIYISMFTSVTFHIYGWLLQNVRFMAFLCKWILPKLHWELLLLLYAICKIPKAIKSPEFKIVTMTTICQKTICSAHLFPRKIEFMGKNLKKWKMKKSQILWYLC